MPEKGKTIALVSCVKTKKGEGTRDRYPAKEIYDSTYFRKMKKVAKQEGDKWFILSAKYGFLKPESQVSYYQKTMDEVNNEKWGVTAMFDLEQHISKEDTIMFLAGSDYVTPLEDKLREFGCEIEKPLAGMRFGPRLRRLNEMMEE